MAKNGRVKELYREIAGIVWEIRKQEYDHGLFKEAGLKEDPESFVDYLEGFTYAIYCTLANEYTAELEKSENIENWRPKCIFPEQR